MLHNDNIISTSVSWAVEKIPTDEKDYGKCTFMCFTLHSHSSYKEQTGIWLVLSTAEVRKSGNKVAGARKEVASYMGA